MTRPRFNRILLKISGEALMGQGQYGIDPTPSTHRRRDRRRQGQGHELCLVIGGGNIFRGMAAPQRASTGRAPTTWACWRR